MSGSGDASRATSMREKKRVARGFKVPAAAGPLIVRKSSAAAHPPGVRPQRRTCGDQQAIGDRPLGRLAKAAESAMRGGRPRRDRRRDPRPRSTRWHFVTDAAPGRGSQPDLRRVATWLPHHARVRVTTAERCHATPSRGRACPPCVPAGRPSGVLGAPAAAGRTPAMPPRQRQPRALATASSRDRQSDCLFPLLARDVLWLTACKFTAVRRLAPGEPHVEPALGQ